MRVAGLGAFLILRHHDDAAADRLLLIAGGDEAHRTFTHVALWHLGLLDDLHIAGGRLAGGEILRRFLHLVRRHPLGDRRHDRAAVVLAAAGGKLAQRALDIGGAQSRHAGGFRMAVPGGQMTERASAHIGLLSGGNHGRHRSVLAREPVGRAERVVCRNFIVGLVAARNLEDLVRVPRRCSRGRYRIGPVRTCILRERDRRQTSERQKPEQFSHRHLPKAFLDPTQRKCRTILPFKPAYKPVRGIYHGPTRTARSQPRPRPHLTFAWRPG